MTFRTAAGQATTATTATAPARRAVLPPLPRIWPVKSIDIGWVLGLNGLLIAAMWVRHGGLDELNSLGGQLTAVGQLTGLYAAYLALVQLVLMSRSPWLDQLFGMDRLAWAHRWLGFATVWLLVAHGIFTITGYALGDNASVLAEAWTIVTTYDWVLPATIGGLLSVAVGISSMAAARRRMSYETWFVLHLLTYAAIALGFLHQLLVGSDFMHDPLARIYWSGLYVLAAGLILAFRIGQPIVLNLRHRLVVGRVVREGPGLVSVYVTGRDLHRLPVRSGQYFNWRFLHGREWWHAHPYSLSSAPNGRWLRITVKALGDGSRRLQEVPVGTRVLVEGPYGAMTGARRLRRKVALIAGGIGIAPLRALLEALPARPGELALVYRARAPKHVIFQEELDLLAQSRGATVEYLVGRRGSPQMPHDPLRAASLRRLVPDIADRDVYVCGPVAMIARVEAALEELGVPRSRVHAERFSFL
ncbi:MAG TPA: ferredoxin reductase family protein [Candidatus Limnocylindrales bacterium]|nr:ferredoxin reductase family protein [Candidatus Limnocylindrales bacterium]